MAYTNGIPWRDRILTRVSNSDAWDNQKLTDLGGGELESNQGASVPIGTGRRLATPFLMIAAPSQVPQ